MIEGRTRSLERWRPGLAALAQLLWPESCVLCGNSRLVQIQPGARRIALCAPCRGQLPWLESACPCCAEPLEESTVCGRCLRDPPAFQTSLIPLRYEAPITTWLLRFKYGGRLADGRLLAALLGHALFHAYREETTAPGLALPQCIVPVPMHPQRLAQRGFNQAALLARDLSQLLAIPWTSRQLWRTRHSAPQSGLNERQRRHNLALAFQAGNGLPQHVALVDDVVTTSSTVRACAQALRAVGVARVSVWAVARTA